MKWFRKHIGYLTIEYMGHSLHSSNYCKHTITYESFRIAWKSQTKFEIITKIKDYNGKYKYQVPSNEDNQYLKQIKENQ